MVPNDLTRRTDSFSRTGLDGACVPDVAYRHRGESWEER